MVQANQIVKKRQLAIASMLFRAAILLPILPALYQLYYTPTVSKTTFVIAVLVYCVFLTGFVSDFRDLFSTMRRSKRKTKESKLL